MISTLVDRLAQVANVSTLRLTHYGRRSGKPYEVTIWFMVEGEVVYLATANRKRQWPRNVAVCPDAKLRIGTETFTGHVEVIADRGTIEHVTDLLAAKSGRLVAGPGTRWIEKPERACRPRRPGA